MIYTCRCLNISLQTGKPGLASASSLPTNAASSITGNFTTGAPPALTTSVPTELYPALPASLLQPIIPHAPPSVDDLSTPLAPIQIPNENGGLISVGDGGIQHQHALISDGSARCAGAEAGDTMDLGPQVVVDAARVPEKLYDSKKPSVARPTQHHHHKLKHHHTHHPTYHNVVAGDEGGRSGEARDKSTDPDCVSGGDDQRLEEEVPPHPQRIQIVQPQGAGGNGDSSEADTMMISPPKAEETSDDHASDTSNTATAMESSPGISEGLKTTAIDTLVAVHATHSPMGFAGLSGDTGIGFAPQVGLPIALNIDLTQDETQDPFLAGWHQRKLNPIVVAQRDIHERLPVLVQRRVAGRWTVVKCLICDTTAYAVPVCNGLQGRGCALVSRQLLSDPSVIGALQQSADYSRVFGVVLRKDAPARAGGSQSAALNLQKPPSLSSFNDNSSTTTSMSLMDRVEFPPTSGGTGGVIQGPLHRSFSSGDSVGSIADLTSSTTRPWGRSPAVQHVQVITSAYLRAEQDAMEERIRLYTEEQNKAYDELKANARAQKTSVLTLLKQHAENLNLAEDENDSAVPLSPFSVNSADPSPGQPTSLGGIMMDWTGMPQDQRPKSYSNPTAMTGWKRKRHSGGSGGQRLVRGLPGHPETDEEEVFRFEADAVDALSGGGVGTGPAFYGTDDEADTDDSGTIDDYKYSLGNRSQGQNNQQQQQQPLPHSVLGAPDDVRPPPPIVMGPPPSRVRHRAAPATGMTKAILLPEDGGNDQNLPHSAVTAPRVTVAGMGGISSDSNSMLNSASTGRYFGGGLTANQMRQQQPPVNDAAQTGNLGEYDHDNDVEPRHNHVRQTNDDVIPGDGNDLLEEEEEDGDDMFNVENVQNGDQRVPANDASSNRHRSSSKHNHDGGSTLYQNGEDIKSGRGVRIGRGGDAGNFNKKSSAMIYGVSCPVNIPMQRRSAQSTRGGGGINRPSGFLAGQNTGDYEDFSSDEEEEAIVDAGVRIPVAGWRQKRGADGDENFAPKDGLAMAESMKHLAMSMRAADAPERLFGDRPTRPRFKTGETIQAHTLGQV